MNLLKLKISKIYYNHGLFCATHPAQVITCVCLIIVFLCFPLVRLPLINDVPLDHVILREDEFQAFENSHLFNSGNPNKSLGYCLQIILHSSFLPPSGDVCSRPHILLADLLEQSAKLVRLIRAFRPSINVTFSSRFKSFEDMCFQVEDRVLSDIESPETVFNMLPTFDCLLLAPSLLWKHQDTDIPFVPGEHLFSRLKQAAVGELRNLFFGMPWKLTGITRTPVCKRSSTMTFAVTIVFREYFPDIIEELREYIATQFEMKLANTTVYANEEFAVEMNNAYTHSQKNTLASSPNSRNVYLVWYRGRSYLSDYAPLILIYVVLLLYVYFSVCKLEMVKSKVALAFSACFTVVASLFMSLGLCITIGLMVPTLSGSEIFPYLVVLIGFENVIVLTKSVVATPVDLPVKYRIAEGLSKESWPLTKQYFTQLVLLCLGFLTFHPTMQEFCLFAMVGVTTDFFLQLFFFVTVLSVDIRRIELSDLSTQFQSVMLRGSKQLVTTQALSTAQTIESPAAAPAASTNGTHTTMLFRGMNHGIVLPFMRYCIRTTLTVCTFFVGWTKFYFWKLTSRFPSKFRPGHKRRVSAAEAAAFLASDEKPTENVPRRLWLFRSWAKHRLIQRIFMFAVAVWLVVFVVYTVDLTKLVKTPESAHATTVSVSLENSTENNLTNPTSSRDAAESNEGESADVFEVSGPSKPSLWDVEFGSTFSELVRGHPLPQPSEALWDNNLLWNYLAFYQWPHLAKHYNLSLCGCHLAILEPIHLRHEIQSSAGADSKVDSGSSEFFSQYFSHDDRQRKFSWNWVSYSALQEFLRQSLNTNPRDSAPSLDEDSDKERSHFLGLPEDLLKMVDNSNSLPGSTHVSPRGIAGWTARLWLTASLLKTSFLGCSLVLFITCLGMICFQELQSKSDTPSQKEPIIRVLPLTIQLPAPGSSDEDDDELIFPPPNWVLACGKHRISNPMGSAQVAGIVAACSLSTTLHLKSPSTDTIWLWCTNSGVALPSLSRYSEPTESARQANACQLRCLIDRRSTVWCMRFLTNGILLVGCSDGTVECWDCKTTQMTALFCLNPGDTTTTTTSPTLPPAGITVLLEVDERGFCVGTSRGHVAWFDLGQDADSVTTTSRLALWHWRQHSRSVMGLKSMLLNDDSYGSSSHHWLLASGAEDGKVCFYSTLTGVYLFEVSLDSTALLSFDFCKLMLAVSHASGNLFVVGLGMCAQPSSKSDSSIISLDMIGEPMKLAHNPKSEVIQRTRTLPHQHTGSIGLHWYCTAGSVIRVDGLDKPNFKAYRLVTCELDGVAAVWNVEPPNLLKTFRLNLSTINPGDPMLNIDRRVIFGDQGYLRVINPWTAKYERSIQLLPPSTALLQNSPGGVSSSVLTAIIRRWSKELAPIGVAGPYCSAGNEIYKNTLRETQDTQLIYSLSGSVLVSVADEGRTLVIIPLTTLRTM